MKYYLVGIKGSGMSALANILIKDGHIVEGVDVEEDFYTSEVLKGVNVIEFKDFSIKDDFIYIIGNAYVDHKVTNLIIEANMKYETYPKFIDKYFKRLSMIGVAGTHGMLNLKGRRKNGLNSSFFRYFLFYFYLKIG